MRLAIPKNALCPFVRPLVAGVALLCAFLVGLLTASPLIQLPAIASAPSPFSPVKKSCGGCPSVRTIQLPSTNPVDPERLVQLYRVPLLRVVDGDTVRVNWHGESTGVHLLSIDAPERGQPGYHGARRYLESLLSGAGQVDLEFERDRPVRDRYGRLLAYLHHDGRNLNVAMIHAGHAVVFDRYSPGKYSGVFRRKTLPP